MKLNTLYNSPNIDKELQLLSTDGIFNPWVVEDSFQRRRAKPEEQLKPCHPNRNSVKYFEIERVIYNAPATIVLWKDGTKTVVKCRHERYDPEKGLAMAIAKRVYGDRGSYYNMLKKHLPKSEEDWSLELRYADDDNASLDSLDDTLNK